MVSNLTFRDTFIVLETFEQGLNIAGYIPLIGSFSAAYIRRNYGQVEIIVGLAFVIFGAGLSIQGNPKAIAYLKFGATLIGHGLLNLIRMNFEIVPGLPLITTLPYDLLATYYIGRRFFSYI
jgi:hypothetical protein